MRALRVACRYLVAFLLVAYGFAKLNQSQFTVIQAALDTPLRDVSGFWLTWHYFGSSTVYGTAVAAAEIVGGSLLLFRRTTLLGVVLLLGVMVNIVLLNISFGIGVLVPAVLITACLVFILGRDREELLRTFWTDRVGSRSANERSAGDRSGDERPAASSRLRSAGAWTARALVLVLPFLATRWIATENNIDPTPLDGVWAVERVEGETEPDRFPLRVYLERNRARMAYFAHSASVTDFADSLEQHQFAVDEASRTLEIRETWRAGMAEGDTVFAGDYRLRGDTLLLRGVIGPPGDSVRARLLRVEAPPGTGVW